ncbi:hypothetical protein PPACK8108_LOCUS9643 [Phakopsora pachyrhizi]|uniref:Uncharacterized protein n=1 Tax=Phakopsora pachyrhizi TaxID=170000 RepID=A0AAV0B1G5_PHAPC|nr:hypothetical protein PPACK8108_LOCUS9643 [Phakopsora pachyrhizi]
MPHRRLGQVRFGWLGQDEFGWADPGWQGRFWILGQVEAGMAAQKFEKDESASRQGKAMMEGSGCGNDTDRAGLAS